MSSPYSWPGDLRICDPHHHLFEDAGLYSTYSMGELAEDMSDVPIVSSIYVECRQHYRTSGPDHLRPVGETEWLAEARQGTVIDGMIAFVDLASTYRTDAIEAHVDAGQGLVVGIRHRAAWDPSATIRASHVQTVPHMLADEAYRDGIRAVGAAGLTFDAFVYFHQLPELAAMARALPEVPIVVDHLGGFIGIGPYADDLDDVRRRWRAGLTDLAACDNVVLKIGGFGRPLTGRSWDGVVDDHDVLARSFWDETEWVLERFGAERCMFESNFPVDRRSFTYRACWQAYSEMTRHLSTAERAHLFHDTAAEAYRLAT